MKKLSCVPDTEDPTPIAHGMVFVPQETIDKLSRHVSWDTKPKYFGTYFPELIGKGMITCVFRVKQADWVQPDLFSWEEHMAIEPGYYYLSAFFRPKPYPYNSFDLGFHGSDFFVDGTTGEKRQYGLPTTHLLVLIDEDPRPDDEILVQTMGYHKDGTQRVCIVAREINNGRKYERISDI